MIVTGGVNVAPAAVEAVLGELRGIGEVCVVGVPDEEWGTAVVAAITLADPAGRSTLSLEDLLGLVRTRVATTLGSPSAPRRLVVVDGLPHRGPGKIDRTAVAALAAGTTSDEDEISR
ncbi:hypothetical protein GCM10025865_05950 [Paraoerskovia sediminicola]|uniref:AMP-binding enzyme C-terminal domain-containing protein n=1 Tax=Paraoerskovia sediminicola TaxID=1138587 RepID=A0ABM8FZZ6_9CELL|nr:class I adenylate-forming enzyme family protein [Paraoerskovia sediminicola]BDZ41296.1 hypothetical protein GCM10025865_05950 [Paraoerskovia sediminicola]